MRVPAVTLLCVIASFAVATARGQDSSWTLSTADFATEQVSLRAIDERGLHVLSAGQSVPRVVPPQAFVQLDRSLAAVERPAKFMLHLVTADRVGGEPVGVKNDLLTWRNPTVGELTVPLTQIAALTK